MSYFQKFKTLTKDDLAEFFRHENLSTIILISISTFFFIFYEAILLAVFSRLLFLDWTQIVLWQIASFSYFGLHLYMCYKHRIYRIIYIISIMIITGGALWFLSHINELTMLKVYLSIILIFSSITLIFSFKFFKENKRRKLQLKGIILILVLLSLLMFSVCSLVLPQKQKIEIIPKTSPELIFFTEPFQMPNDNDTMYKYGLNGISFMPSLGPWTLNSSSLMDRLKLAVQNGVNIYVNLVPRPADFANINNVYKFREYYQDFKEWFTEEGIFNSQYIKAFCLDAEPPQEISDEVGKGDVYDGLNYLIDNFPSEKDIENATESLEHFIDLIHEDGKEAGITRTRPNLDENDGDGDIELISRNIYSLDVKWDYSITMLYRSQRVLDNEPGSAQNTLGKFFRDINNAKKTGDSFVYSKYYFYFYSGIEQTQGDINADEQYIFLGNYKAEFEETPYIKDKEFFKDLDICRHFSEERVFFYNYEGLIYLFGDNVIEELIKHNKQFESWEIIYDSIETQANIVMLMFLVFVDRILYLDPLLRD